MGRPSKLNDEVEARICEALELGYPHEAAAAYAGISARAFYNWKAKGEKAQRGRYVQFVQAVKKAEAMGEGALVHVVRTAALRDWKAAMTMLERRWPQRWARRVFKPDDAPPENISVTFNIPPVDPTERGDDLVVQDTPPAPSNGNGNGNGGNDG